MKKEEMILAIQETEMYKSYSQSRNDFRLTDSMLEIFYGIFEAIEAGWSYSFWESQTVVGGLIKAVAEELFQKYGVIIISKYRTYDGELFDTADEAKAHIRAIEVKRSITDFFEKKDLTDKVINSVMEAIDEDFAGFRSLFEK